jgi:L-ascorbate metabolism protein UlaG (beta-lactamase superfamily)
MAECYSLLVEHSGRSVLVQSSAGYRSAALAGWTADVAYLGVGTLGRQPESHRQAYWREVTEAVGARRVLPIHWDDFWRPLDRPLVPMPAFVDDFEATLDSLRTAAARGGVDVRVPTAWQPTDPFLDL